MELRGHTVFGHECVIAVLGGRHFRSVVRSLVKRQEQLFLLPVRAEFLDRAEAGEEEQLSVSFFRMGIFTCNIKRRRQRSAEGEDAGNRCLGWSK